MVKVFQVTMVGQWAGGMVIVSAENEAEAMQLARDCDLYRVYPESAIEIPSLRSLKNEKKVLAKFSISE